MKAITVWQPWASLIAIGAKPYEFRGRASPRSLHGERIAIHAGARAVRPVEVRALTVRLRGSEPWLAGLKPEIALPVLDKLLLNPASAPISCVVATALLGGWTRADLVMSEFGGPLQNDSDREAHFNFAWHLEDVEEMRPPIPARGAQGFWEWTQ